MRHQAFFPTLFFLLLVATLTVSLLVSDRPPFITRIAPEIGVPGSVLVIEGRNFGDSRNAGAVTIGNVRPISSSYLEWTDTRISLQIPDEVASGLVRVVTELGASNGALFTNRNLIPVVVTDPEEPGHPVIETVTPEKARVGELVTISGLNFGPSRGDGAVEFTAIPSSDQVDDVESSIRASEIDYDYESWSEQSVRVRVPDGASSGTVRIVTDRGESNSRFFEVVRVGGAKSLQDRQGYQLACSIEVDRVKGAPDGTLDLWVPEPILTPAQREVEAIRSPSPLWSDYLGLSRFILTDFEPEAAQRIELMYWVERYALETRIDATRVIETYDTRRKLYREYTAADRFVPSDDESIIQAARSAAGGETNPYLQARSVYLFVLTQMTYDGKSPGKSILDAFIAARGDSRDYSVLYCAMLRSLGIPARPVAGVLVYDTRRTRTHHWAEFYLEGYGWIPVDAVLGDAVTFGDARRLDAPEVYYFGNIDERHIVYTRGIIDVAPAQNKREASQARRLVPSVPSFQTFHEQVSEAIESYRSEWSPVEVLDFW